MAKASTYQFRSGAFALISDTPINYMATPVSATLAGTNGADQMRDAAGGVILSGGAGDDSYYVGDLKTTITESGGAGHDTVHTFVSFKAGANIENITVLKTGVTATGNELGNLITTKVAGATLVGGAGDDVLVDAGTGSNVFGFSAGTGKDVVYGFTAAGTAKDAIKLEGLGLTSFAQVQSMLTQVGADTLITLNGSDSVLLKDVSLSSLTVGNFTFDAPRTGVYVGNNPSDLSIYESWIGEPADLIGLHAGRANWADWQGSLDWLIGRFSAVNAEPAWTLPLFVLGGSLSQGAAGAYNQYYLKAAQSLAASQPTGDILIRTGVEFNGDWMPWAAQGQEAAFAANFRQFVDTFRTVSDRFKFEWNVNAGDFGVDVAASYPGDAYVDYIGMDFYYDTQWYGTDPQAAWNTMVNQKYGLKWLEDFAALHGKPSAYSEWGVNSNNAGVFIQNAAEWFATHNVAYQIYWDSDAAFAGRLDSNQYPSAGAAYLAAFGSGTPNAGYALDPALVPTGPGNPPPPSGDPDTVTSDVTTTLASNKKTLILTGAANINGKGNSLNNLITGNEGANVLEGLSGDDVLSGGGGNDTLNGGSGKDAMSGGAGDDVYYVDTSSDTVIEAAGGGIDTVRSSISYTLGAEVEKLILEGSSSNSATGNALDNHITGNSGANRIIGGEGNDTLLGMSGKDTLDGGAGNDILDGGSDADTLSGGAGDDIYYLDNSRDVIIETAGGGVDTVYTGSTHTLGDNVENLSFLWDGSCWGYGNALDNVMTGNGGDNYFEGKGGADTLLGGAGKDKLIGGAGNDRLTGGAGNDTLVFAKGCGLDVVTDFARGDVVDITNFKSSGLQATLTNVGSDCVISFTTGETITLLGVSASALAATSAGYGFL